MRITNEDIDNLSQLNRIEFRQEMSRISMASILILFLVELVIVYFVLFHLNIFLLFFAIFFIILLDIGIVIIASDNQTKREEIFRKYFKIISNRKIK